MDKYEMVFQSNPIPFFEDFLKILVDFYRVIEPFIPALFVFLKYTLVAILYLLGFLTLLKLRGIYIKQRLINTETDQDQLKRARLILGSTYIVLASGILFNYLIYVLVWLLNPIKGFWFPVMELIYTNLSGSIDLFLNFTDLGFPSSFQGFVGVIHPFIAMGSFYCLLGFILSFFYLINNNRVISNPRRTILFFLTSSAGVLFFGVEFIHYFL